MTQAEFNSYRFDSQHEPTEEQLGQLMENAAKKVQETNRESDKRFFAKLRQASEEAKKRGKSESQMLVKNGAKIVSSTAKV